MRRLSRVTRILLIAFLVGLFIYLIAKSKTDNAEKGDYSLYSYHSFHEASPALYSFENWSSLSPKIALKIQHLWSQELSQVTLQGNRSVTDQMIENDGQPERVLLITRWRSGSSYVGSILRSRPGTHYFYEPLHNSYEKIVVREAADIHDALLILRDLLLCRIQERHITKETDSFFNRNVELCRTAKEVNIDKDPTFMTLMCRRSPILAMKIVRLRLRQAESLLEDEKLNVKIIYLVRDPRATMNSRLQRWWCKEIPECENFSLLCSDLVDDYVTAKKLEGKYPDRFMKLRYEDLLTRPETSKQLSEFLKIGTSLRSGRGSSQLTKWTRELGLTMDYVGKIQANCAEAMDLWGYKSVKTLPANLSDILKSFVN